MDGDDLSKLVNSDVVKKYPIHKVLCR